MLCWLLLSAPFSSFFHRSALHAITTGTSPQLLHVFALLLQWVYYAYLAAVKEQDGAAMSMGRIDA
jgi:hypothetical protein